MNLMAVRGGGDWWRGGGDWCEAAAILRRRAVYGGWIGLVTSAGKQMSCVVGLCCLAASALKPPPGPPTLTRAFSEPRSCSIYITGNEWENDEWVTKPHSIYGAKRRQYLCLILLISG